MALFEAAVPELQPKASAARGTEILCLVAAIVAITGIGLHFIQPPSPLWLDETWTAYTAAQASFPALMTAIYNDTCGPLYYLVIHYWSVLFGLSDETLRLPSVLACALAPLLAFSLDNEGDPKLALLWCSLLAIWVPGLVYSEEARCYGLLFLLCVGSTAAYANLLLKPSLIRAIIWTLLSTLAFLTHYHAGFLILCQGLGYLAIHREKALCTWPAAAIFLPAFGWILYHGPRVAQLVAPDVAWYMPLSLSDFIHAAGFAGADLLLIAFLLKKTSQTSPTQHPIGTDQRKVRQVVFITSATGAIIVFALGLYRPSFTVRYIFPFAPGVLFGAALLFHDKRDRWLRVSLVLIFLLITAQMSLFSQRFSIAKFYNWEVASLALMKDEPQRLVFLWEYPAAKVLSKESIKGVGGFFFARENRSIDVEPIYITKGEDPNKALLDKAGNDPDTALLWLYDLNLAGTAAHRYPNRIAALDPSWTCEDFGRGKVGIIACSHKRPH